MQDQIQFKCPNCGGAIEFDSTQQTMKCPYCGSEFDPQALRSLDDALSHPQPDKLDWSSSSSEWGEGETEGLAVYTCRSCGGEIVADENTGATRCPYCDNPVVLTGRFAGALRPDLVIPFKLDKRAAVEALKKHLQGKRLLPKVFKDENHIDEVKGIYVPFWLFDADVEADLRFRATRVRTWNDSKYEYTQTSYYSVARGGRVAFDRVPVDGSSKIDDDLMESIEPFDHRAAVDFQTAYLSGYLADKYDVDAEQSVDRANQRIKRSTEQAFASTVTGYASVQPEQTSVRLARGTSRYALYPVWLLNTTWRDSRYTFAMNGQTGRFVGDLPCDSGLAAKWTLGVGAISTAAIFAALGGLWYATGLDLMSALLGLIFD